MVLFSHSLNFLLASNAVIPHSMLHGEVSNWSKDCICFLYAFTCDRTKYSNHGIGCIQIELFQPFCVLRLSLNKDGLKALRKGQTLGTFEPECSSALKRIVANARKRRTTGKIILNNDDTLLNSVKIWGKFVTIYFQKIFHYKVINIRIASFPLSEVEIIIYKQKFYS